MTSHRFAARAAAFVACATLSLAAHAAANLVVNGSFETGPGGLGSFAYWQTALGDADTFVDSSGQSGRNYDQATDGLWFALFGSLPANGGATISQVLLTTPGTRYLLGFDLANSNLGLAANNRFTVSVGNVTLFDAVNLPQQNYLHYSVDFVANAALTTLSLGGYNAQSFLELDAVSVSAVPEPASALLMLGGLALLRRRAMQAKR